MTNQPSISTEVVRDAITQLKAATRLLERAVEREAGKEQECTHPNGWGSRDKLVCRDCKKILYVKT